MKTKHLWTPKYGALVLVWYTILNKKLGFWHPISPIYFSRKKEEAYSGCVNPNFCMQVMHKNLAVCKIMEVIRTKRYSVSARLKVHMKQMISVHCSWSFSELFDKLSGEGALERRHSFLYFFSLVLNSAFLYVNFSSTCVGCMHLLKS